MDAEVNWHIASGTLALTQCNAYRTGATIYSPRVIGSLITRYRANSDAIASTLHDQFALHAGSPFTHDADDTMCECILLNSGCHQHYSERIWWHSRSHHPAAQR